MIFAATPSQQEVIDATEPVVLVLGGAGTGKTVTAAAAARAHLQIADAQQQVTRQAAWASGQRIRLEPPARVLLLSFSRTAVAQIHDRSAGLLAGYRDRIEITTFHGMAWRLVQQWGRYIGLPPPLTLVSAAEQKLLGAGGQLTYDDLLPSALRALRIPQVAEHYDTRYSLVICDEFQDTEDTEWELVRRIAPSARIVLLGDLNQCIFKFKGLNPYERIRQAEVELGARKIPLTEGSQRDPTQIIPTAAKAVLYRRFDSKELRTAVEANRLKVVRTTMENSIDAVVQAVKDARDAQHSVGIFTHGNKQTADLSQALADRNVRHQAIGFGEAYAEALSAQTSLFAHALGQIPFADARKRLAVFVCSSIRSNDRPRLALDLLRPMSGFTSELLIHRLDELSSQLVSAGTVGNIEKVVSLITDAHHHLLLPRGATYWAQAAVQLAISTTDLVGQYHAQGLASIEEHIQRLRTGSLTSSLAEFQAKVQVMNLHQTKGRESDTTVVLVQEGVHYGKEKTEPFVENSRLLYVVLTRARKRTVIVAAGTPPDFIAPLIDTVVRSNSRSQ